MFDDETKHAEKLLKEFKGDDYAFGEGVLERVGDYAYILGRDLVVISGQNARCTNILDTVVKSLINKGLNITNIFDGARPNAPKEDVYRIAYQLSQSKWNSVVVVGGGSCIDASKAALTLATYGGIIDDYFGTGKISEKSNGEQLPLIAVQTASSSGAHLTKYSNITDLVTHQKKLIVDNSIIPKASIFQYDVTKTKPPNLTKDGALDGISHCWEVWMGSTGKDIFPTISEVAYLGITLIVNYLPIAVENSYNLNARYALGLGTDLGGYAIMIGGTNGGHLGSFSLINLLSHGRACTILNPYYTILFSPTIQDQLKKVAKIYQNANYIEEDTEKLNGRKLAEAVAQGMIKLSKSIEFPITLKEIGASDEHIEKMINAAKDPQLRMKLQNMPIRMDSASDVDKFMRPTLEAAFFGDISLIPNLHNIK
ncbi:MAG: iron-containing alcohol dehydrogenase [Candidatus Bathyarchaeota archaeon]|nr:MAG: iron-containing alcohol dehydrogenase [Candidatus Bathyarchaeota archaeon]